VRDRTVFFQERHTLLTQARELWVLVIAFPANDHVDRHWFHLPVAHIASSNGPSHLLRDVIDATVGFARLGRRIDVPEELIMRMFGPTGNPRAENLIAVVAALKDQCRLSLTEHAAPLRRRTARALAYATT
jgi:DNA-binding phage protein